MDCPVLPTTLNTSVSVSTVRLMVSAPPSSCCSLSVRGMVRGPWYRYRVCFLNSYRKGMQDTAGAPAARVMPNNKLKLLKIFIYLKFHQ